MALRLGSDFGGGYAVYIDGVLDSVNTANIWWNNDWNNGAVIDLATDYEAGEHVITFYGFEDCCDGNFDL
jgi:hypothetical protein